MDQRIQTYLQGASETGYEVFGAHLAHEYGQDGTRFTVYAPQARLVQLIGGFNDWQGWDMSPEGGGVWSIFAQNVGQGALYKYRISTADGGVYDRADPFAFFSEKRPDTASIVCGLGGFPWTDGAYLAQRSKHFDRAMHIYELHAGSWRRAEDGGFLDWDALADALIPYVLGLGCTHIELLPLTEHPFDGSWGYQTAGYFSATSRYGTPEQLMRFIDRCHRAGLGVLLDFVPLHFVCDFYALHQFDGGFLYESEDEALRFSEWGTALFDYTKPHVLSFMKSALDFWLSYYHIDGLRYDAVSRLIYHGGDPQRGVNEAGVWFLKNANFALSQKWPDVMLIAEDSSMYLKVTAPVAYGGLGFDYKWDLGFMNDVFGYFAGERRGADRISASTEYFYQEKYILPFSHDEVVHGKRAVLQKLPGTPQEQFARARVLYLYLFTHPGKKLSFMGNEFAACREWSEEGALDWALASEPSHAAFARCYAALGALYRGEPALYETDLHPEGFRWLRAGGGVFLYERCALSGKRLLAALNVSGRTEALGLPGGAWEVGLSTDDADFGGAGRSLLPHAHGPLNLPALCGCVLAEKF